MSINRFFTVSLLLMMAILYAAFTFYFLLDQQKKTDLVLDAVHQDLSETAYIISSQLNNINNLNHFKSLLIRKVVNANTFSAITVVKDDQLLLSTDPSITAPPSALERQNLKFPETSAQLLDTQIYEAKVHFFIQDQPQVMSLFFYSNQNFLHTYFQEVRNHFLIVFGVFPLIILAIFWLLLRRYITLPLEKLRQYAYYQSTKPSPLKVKELEYVRASMVQTFQRLDEERQELYRLARTDHLSGLANRNQLQERLKRLISKSRREKAEFALVFIDLDNFKTVNDSLGHDVGDELLKSIAKTLTEQLREYDIISRVGGDEFVIVMSNGLLLRDLNRILKRLITFLSRPMRVRGHTITISASMGIAFYPQDGHDLTGLMKSADMAMYDAKKSGKNQFKYFTQTLQDLVNYEIEMEADIRHALQHQQFELYYQPQIDTQTQQVIGVEALIRWNHPIKGFIAPLDFIPAAEKNGLIIRLGYWVTQTAIQQQVAWLNSDMGSLKMSINVSAHQLKDPKFESFLMETIQKSQASPLNIELEMTESVLLENSESNLTLIAALRESGIQIALDDFGTGYSSLSYLKHLPINTLKIDKSFMDDYTNDIGAVFIEAMVNIAKTLNINVVAEGIESVEQLDYLKTIHCQFYQGYYGSRPLNAEQFEIWFHAYQAQFNAASTL